LQEDEKEGRRKELQEDEKEGRRKELQVIRIN
jgi:hypothetical protein